MHRWSPHCALGWLQAELEEAEQEAEVRGGGWACMGTRRETHTVHSGAHYTEDLGAPPLESLR